MDAGSGAKEHIPLEMIQAVSGILQVPLIVGGGIRDAQTAQRIAAAGADIIVVGNAFEKNPDLIFEIKKAIS